MKNLKNIDSRKLVSSTLFDVKDGDTFHTKSMRITGFGTTWKVIKVTPKLMELPRINYYKNPKNKTYTDRNPKVRCNNCNRPIKQNVIDRKQITPWFCYHCYLRLVKGYLNITITRKKNGLTKTIHLPTKIELNKKKFRR
ncbi:hypothetical protein HYO65_gp193 [Tenacibaculum phage PTm1]|uniref:Uncharacterized protein n=2 Tax=Shirahamavirus PTm1 TaxID=2846435 RepID=A0A5S9HXB2_9CAUD|nr:hypothetical protein HYO65_gp193 [Tenacibaculum phage PTm1]BBI90585.1 hypothetical protein [Tenacibaculum phage PTm1]BBI90893.1 hypothetical protein [Tenacibaculum phage PTm5]